MRTDWRGSALFRVAKAVRSMDADFSPALDLHNLTRMDDNLDRIKLDAGDSAQNFLADITGDRVVIL
jgi:hypothetical protein